MTTFDHERLDVYRAAIEFIVSMLTRMAKPRESGTGTGTGTGTSTEP